MSFADSSIINALKTSQHFVLDVRAKSYTNTKKNSSVICQDLAPLTLRRNIFKKQKTSLKATVLKLFLPGGKLYGLCLSRKKQLVRLKKDFYINIALPTLSQWMREFHKENQELAKIVEQLRQQEKDDLKEKVLSLILPGGKLSELTREEQKQRLKEDFGIQRSTTTLTH